MPRITWVPIQLGSTKGLKEGHLILKGIKVEVFSHLKYTHKDNKIAIRLSELYILESPIFPPIHSSEVVSHLL